MHLFRSVPETRPHSGDARCPKPADNGRRAFSPRSKASTTSPRGAGRRGRLHHRYEHTHTEVLRFQLLHVTPSQAPHQKPPGLRSRRASVGSHIIDVRGPTAWDIRSRSSPCSVGVSSPIYVIPHMHTPLISCRIHENVRFAEQVCGRRVSRAPRC